MRLPRMTTRRWMVAVMIAAAGLCVSVLGARSHSYTIRAGHHGLMEVHNRWMIEEYEAGRLFNSGPADQLAQRADRCRRLIAYHAALGRNTSWPHAGPGSPSDPTRRRRGESLRAQAVIHRWRGRSGAG
jgi:hypothetical protein